MLYREFGKTGEKLSILGFGAMRLPVIDNDDSNIDEEKAIRMIRHSIDEGVNYLDTAYVYHGGMSEKLCAKVMKDGYREKVKIATKFPGWVEGDMMPILDEQLAKLEVDCIDFYLLHAMCHEFWGHMKKNDYKSFLDEAKRTGKIKYAGFSFHDDIRLFKEIVDDYDWDFCQIQFNYMDDEYQAGKEGLEYAAGKGLGIVIMEPLRGGMLSRKDLPEEVEKLWKKAPVYRTPAEWALRYIWNYPEIGVVLSGMGTMEQVEENIRTACDALPNSLTEEEQSIIRQVKDFFLSRTRVNCTNCHYCMPCPAGVNIPEHFWAYNHESQFDDFGKAKYWVTDWLKESERASNCVECGQCENHCPQNITIRKHLKDIIVRYA